MWQVGASPGYKQTLQDFQKGRCAYIRQKGSHHCHHRRLSLALQHSDSRLYLNSCFSQLSRMMRLCKTFYGTLLSLSESVNSVASSWKVKTKSYFFINYPADKWIPRIPLLALGTSTGNGLGTTAKQTSGGSNCVNWRKSWGSSSSVFP